MKLIEDLLFDILEEKPRYLFKIQKAILKKYSRDKYSIEVFISNFKMRITIYERQ